METSTLQGCKAAGLQVLCAGLRAKSGGGVKVETSTLQGCKAAGPKAAGPKAAGLQGCTAARLQCRAAWLLVCRAVL